MLTTDKTPLTLALFEQFTSDQFRDPTSATRRLWPNGECAVVLTWAQVEDLKTAIRQAGGGMLISGAALALPQPPTYTGPCIDLDGVARDAVDVQYLGSWAGIWILRADETLPEHDFAAVAPLASGA